MFTSLIKSIFVNHIKYISTLILVWPYSVKTSLKMTLTFRVVKEPSDTSRLGGLAHSSENATMCRSVVYSVFESFEDNTD